MAAGDLTTLAKVRLQQQRTDSGNTSQDAIIEGLITSASSMIVKYTQREFTSAGGTPIARVFRYDGRGILNLAPYDARTVTAVRVDTDTSNPSALDSAQWREWPVTQVDGVITHLHLRDVRIPTPTTQAYPVWREVEVTGTWGWAAVPDQVERACTLLTLDLLSRTSSWKAAEFDGLGMAPGGAAMPLHVKTMLAPYRRHTAGV